MGLTKRDIYYLNLARQEAKFSNYNNVHMGAIIVYKNDIISKGHNSTKTHPKQKYYNRKYRKFYNTGTIYDSLHAEMAALLNIERTDIEWSKVKVYIYRIAPGLPCKRGMARPCEACFQALKDRGIKHIYYTTNEGYAYEKIM